MLSRAARAARASATTMTSSAQALASLNPRVGHDSSGIPSLQRYGQVSSGSRAHLVAMTITPTHSGLERLLTIAELSDYGASPSPRFTTGASTESTPKRSITRRRCAHGSALGPGIAIPQRETGNRLTVIPLTESWGTHATQCCDLGALWQFSEEPHHVRRSDPQSWPWANR